MEEKQNKGQFQKGHKINLGKKHSKEWKENHGKKIKELWKTSKYREKIIFSIKGKKKPPFTDQHIKNMSISRKGIHSSPKTEFKKGFKHTQEFKENLSKRITGENNWNWQGGISRCKHDKFFNNKFKRLIRKRDNQICMLCGVHREKLKRALDVHHVNYDKLFTVPQNCISLCLSCHSKTNKNRKYWINFFQDLLTEKYSYQYSENKVVMEIQNG